MSKAHYEVFSRQTGPEAKALDLESIIEHIADEYGELGVRDNEIEIHLVDSDGFVLKIYDSGEVLEKIREVRS